MPQLQKLKPLAKTAKLFSVAKVLQPLDISKLHISSFLTNLQIENQSDWTCHLHIETVYVNFSIWSQVLAALTCHLISN